MNGKTFVPSLVLVLYPALLVFGCTGQSDVGPSQEGCPPRLSVPCNCVSGDQGSALCLDDGSGFSECNCPNGGDGANLSMGDSWQQPAVAGTGGIGGAGGASGEEFPQAGSGGTAGEAGNAGEAGSAGEMDVMDGGGVDDGGGSIISDGGVDSGTVTPNPDQDEVPATAYCAPVSSWDPSWTAWEEEVLALVNERRAAGASCGSEGSFGPAGPLTMNPNLRCSARLHSMDMAQNDYFDHYSLDGRDPFDRMADAGYTGGTMGENIASGQMSPQDVMNGWMGSDGHCANIMNASFTEIGVGYYEIAGTGSGWYGGGSRLWTQNFGAPSTWGG